VIRPWKKSCTSVLWNAALRAPRRCGAKAGPELYQSLERAEKLKAGIRANVEHLFRLIKRYG
jgi:hypothetical protein